jgi:DNA-binding NarL/FixJ family response regulator
MTSTKTPVILVIDDDPLATASIRHAAPPGWQVHEAHDGVVGLKTARAQRSSLSLVILDVHMPHDGVMVAVQIRHEFPDIPILPCTADDRGLAVMALLGCAPPLLKPAPTHAITAALEEAITFCPPPLTASPLLTYTYQCARDSERHLRQQRATLQVATLTSSDMVRSGLRASILAAGGTINIEATSARSLRRGLACCSVGLLVADSRLQDEAALVARELKLPLLIVALSVTTGYRAVDVGQGVVVDPVAIDTLAQALAQVAAGGRFCDPALDASFANGLLSVSEKELLVLVLQGWETEAIIERLKLQPQTVREYRSRIYAKLGVTSLNQLYERVDALQHLQARQVGSSAGSFVS